MKLNPLEWSQIENGKQIQAPSGVVQLRGSAPFAVLVSALGVETVQFVAAQTRLRLPEAATFKVIPSQEGLVVFMKDTRSRVVRMTGEKFTNIDRLPQESGTMLEVTRALRLMKLEERAMVRRIREERAAAEEVIERAKPKAPEEAEPPKEPEPPKEEPVK